MRVRGWGTSAAALLGALAAAGLQAEPIFRDGFEPICGTYYTDVDGDGYGQDGTGTALCGPLPGYALQAGDCLDGDATVFPGAYDFPDDAMNNDCVAGFDDPPTCDEALSLGSNDPMDAARAMELCTVAGDAPGSWGLLSAAWVQPSGDPPPMTGVYDFGHGIEAAFGSNVAPQAGARMLVLSSGTARQPSSPGYVADFNKAYPSEYPPGHPIAFPGCPPNAGPHDGIALEVLVRAPPNAVALSFQARYYTRDWPSFVCTTFADRVVVQMAPAPEGAQAGIILYDKTFNPVWEGSVEACGCVDGPPCIADGREFSCPLGTAPLAGTGFEGFAATDWLAGVAPVTPGEDYLLRFSVYDSGDGTLDSSVLLDALRWLRSPP